MNHRPVAIGMVLCEQVIVDERSRNVTPVNCFNSRELDSLPGNVTFYALAWLTDGIGEMPVEIVIERLDTMQTVFRMERTLRFTNPLQEFRFIARIRSCDFPVAGYYDLTLSVDRELIAHRKFLIQQQG